MRILIDIGHPAHIHYFRNFIIEMISRGHKILIVARERGIILDLLKFYKLDFVKRGEGGDSKLGKIMYMFYGNFKILKFSIKFRPDLFLSFSSPYAAQISYLLGKPHIALTDTEHADKILSIFTYSFSSIILTPSSYKNDLGKKHLKFKSVVESFYLNSKYFISNKSVKKLLNVSNNEEYVVIRFVSWKAHHDYGHSGLDIETTREIIKILEPYYKIFISSEVDLPKEFIQYQLNTPIDRIHDVLAYATIFIGESATMASESALLGTYAIYINSLPLMGYLSLEQDSGLLKYFNSTAGVVKHISEVVKIFDFKKMITDKSIKMKNSFIDPTSFLVWFVEDYPKSKNELKLNPNYQIRFK